MAAVITENPTGRADILCDSEKALFKQAGAVKGRFQDDGWGMAYFSSGSNPLTFKSAGPARVEKAAFRRAALAASGADIVLAHLRDASNPKGLARSKLLGLKNSQPFCGNGFTFAHNGTLYIPDEIKSALGKYAGFVKGNNDSEVLFWQIMKMLDAYGTAELALEMALDEITTVWLSCKKRYPQRNAPYRGMNIMLADSKNLWVLCHCPKSWDRGALLTPGWEFGRLAWRREKDAFVFSSEPLDGGSWNKLADLDLAEVSLIRGKLELKIKKLYCKVIL
ncbi:MAG: class II glutamine amidotransferase [Elusimicrobia bacterium]|nr:class II glutamine amidotransferase [Elusimicrobiota bacterium]